jgi:hypothetical protein
MPAAQAQVPVQVRVTVNIPGQLPNGVTRYRVELRCLRISGIPDPGAQNLIEYVDRLGGTATYTIYPKAGTACRFRLVIEGTGSRGASGTAVYVGGSARGVSVLTTIDGVAQDVNTAFESIEIPIEAATTAIWGDPNLTPTTTTIPTTTVAPTLPPTTTTIPTTTTTRPVVTAPPTVAPPPPTIAPPPTAPALKIVRTTRCRSRYRFVEIRTNRVVRCLTSSEVSRLVRR